MSLNQPTLEILSVNVLDATILCYPQIMALDNILINIVYLGDVRYLLPQTCVRGAKFERLNFKRKETNAKKTQFKFNT